MVLVCHVILQNHVIKGSLWVGAHHGELPSYQFGGHSHPGSGAIIILVFLVIF